MLNTELMHHAAVQKVSHCLSGGQQESVRCRTSMAALSHLTTSSLKSVTSHPPGPSHNATLSQAAHRVQTVHILSLGGDVRPCDATFMNPIRWMISQHLCCLGRVSTDADKCENFSHYLSSLPAKLLFSAPKNFKNFSLTTS